MAKKILDAPKPAQVVLQIEDIKFCNLTNIRMTQEEGLLMFHSGSTVVTFAFSPGHIKRLAKSLADVVKAYEKKVGKIDTHEKPSKQ